MKATPDELTQYNQALLRAAGRALCAAIEIAYTESLNANAVHPGSPLVRQSKLAAWHDVTPARPQDVEL